MCYGHYEIDSVSKMTDGDPSSFASLFSFSLSFLNLTLCVNNILIFGFCCSACSHFLLAVPVGESEAIE